MKKLVEKMVKYRNEFSSRPEISHLPRKKKESLRGIEAFCFGGNWE